jgi:hypothetical protein
LSYWAYFRSAKDADGEWDIENDWNHSCQILNWNAEFSLQYESIS